MSLQRPQFELNPRKSLGLRVKELRADFGFTQEELAERSGLFRTYLSRIESGQANPTLTVLYQVAAAFPIDARELLTPATTSTLKKVKAPPARSRGRVQQ